MSVQPAKVAARSAQLIVIHIFISISSFDNVLHYVVLLEVIIVVVFSKFVCLLFL